MEKYTRIKDIAIDLQELAEDTGYDYDFLGQQFDECIRDGMTPEAAMRLVQGISYELDW